MSYINILSNHLLNIIKRLPNSVNNLLPRNSSSKEIFDNTKEDYQKALDKSGYKTKPLYKENNNKGNSKENYSKNNTSNKQGKYKIIWFNHLTTKVSSRTLLKVS